MKRAAVLCLLLWPALAWAQSVELPKEATGDPGAFIKVPAKTDGSQVRWYSPDKGLQVFPVELLKDTKTAVVIANAKGRYRLIAWTAKGDVPSDPAVCTVVVGEVPPGPVPPGPTPGPIDDPLVGEYQAAYDKETDADKEKLRTNLTALYKAVAEMVSKDDYSATWEELFNAVGKAAQSLGVYRKLQLVQGASQKILQDRLPSTPEDRAKKMTTDDKKLVADTFKRFAGCLGEVK